MDEALATAAVDVGGRPYAVIDLELTTERIGTLTTQNLPHALEALCRTAGITLHLTARWPQRSSRRRGGLQGPGPGAAGRGCHRPPP